MPTQMDKLAETLTTRQALPKNLLMIPVRPRNLSRLVNSRRPSNDDYDRQRSNYNLLSPGAVADPAQAAGAHAFASGIEPGAIPQANPDPIQKEPDAPITPDFDTMGWQDATTHSALNTAMTHFETIGGERPGNWDSMNIAQKKGWLADRVPGWVALWEEGQQNIIDEAGQPART